MNYTEKEKLIKIIEVREKLKKLSRLKRLFAAPLRTLPFYILAALGHIRPFKVSFKTLWNTSMTCYLPEGNTFYYYGYCEANLTNFFLRYVKEGMTFMDIGAHVGFYSMLLSELVGEKGSVHAFEPTPWTHKLLTQNTEKLSNVTVNNLALDDKEAELMFADYGPGYGAYNSAHPDGAAALSKKATMTKVRSIALDEYGKQHSLQPDIVKIDAEGFEYHVLLGMTHILSRNENHIRPIITLEVAGENTWAEDRDRSFDLLLAAQYEPYEIHTTGILQKHKLKKTYAYDNLVFIPTERLDELSPYFNDHS